METTPTESFADKVASAEFLRTASASRKSQGLRVFTVALVPPILLLICLYFAGAFEHPEPKELEEFRAVLFFAFVISLFGVALTFRVAAIDFLLHHIKSPRILSWFVGSDTDPEESCRHFKKYGYYYALAAVWLPVVIFLGAIALGIGLWAFDSIKNIIPDWPGWAWVIIVLLFFILANMNSRR